MPGRGASDRVLDVVMAGAGALLAVLIVTAALGGRDRDGDLSRDPLSLAALRDLGLALDQRGRSDRADAVLSFVERRTRRDGPTDVWLLRRRLEQGRYRDAFASADALLRRDADETTRPVLFPLLIAAAAYDDARPALVARLADRPWWRGDFLRDLAARGEAAGAAAVFTELSNTAAPAAADEYAPFINRLVSDKDYVGAVATWRRVARARDASDQGLRDGDFAGRSDGSSFTWSAVAGAGAEGEVGPTPDGAPGRALRVDYDGVSSPSLPAQLLVLSPGSYVVSWRQRIAPSVPESLFWRIRCADSGRTAARAPPAEDAGAAASWRPAAMSFVAPAGGCAGQWLELVAAPGERPRPVTAWFAGFRLWSTR